MKNGYDKFFKEAKKAAEQNKRFALRDERHGSPEDQVREELKSRLAVRKNQRQKRSRVPFPIFPSIFAAAVLASALVGYLRPELGEAVLAKVNRHVEIGFLGKASANEEKAAAKDGHKDGAKVSSATGDQAAEKSVDAAKAAEGKSANGEKSSSAKVAGKDEKAPDVRGWSEEELSFFKKLNERKKELDLREAELNKLEEELQKQKTELDEKIKTLDGMRSEIAKTLKSRFAADQEKVDKLVNFYSTMKAPQAAKIIETLNEDLAVEILDKMKKKNVAEIMNTMDAKKARRLSELLTGYQRTPATTQTEADDAAAAEAEKALNTNKQ